MPDTSEPGPYSWSQVELEMPALVHAKDWSATPLGPMDGWSQSLKTAMDMILSSGFPMALRWGPDFVLIYNDGYKTILGDKHPWALGLPAREAWSEVWAQIEPIHLQMLNGERGAVFAEDMVLRIRRHGGLWEDGHFTLGYSPTPDATAPSGVGGIFVTAVETTLRVEAERQRRLADEALHDLNETLEQKVEARTVELERAQAALRQASKMEAIGQLTGGIAHDFNNMLAIVVANVDIAIRRAERGDGDVKRYLDNAMEGALRAGALTQRLLAVSRQSPLSPRVLDVNALVAGMADLLRRTLGERVVLETSLAPDLWLSQVDANQLESAVLNLAVNARDAMPDGGTLRIETRNLTLSAEGAERAGLHPGDHIQIEMTDSGAGMTAEVLERVFDPFFTTKPVGQGTGLGLSMVYGFARQSGGYVRIRSEAGSGTSVNFCLPRYAGDLAAAPSKEPAPDSAREVAAHKLVLVVEDDDRVRQSTGDALRHLGCHVHVAADAREALALFDMVGPVDLLMTDVVMPGMSGRELADALQARAPGLKVLFTTGYARDIALAGATAPPALLPKPFTLEDLARELVAVLEA